MNDKLKETQDIGPDGFSLVYLKVSEDAQVQIAVAYLRTSARGVERALALVEQQTAVQRFADAAGYKVVGWYVEGDGVEVTEPALSQLMADVVPEGREFNAVLVWNYRRLSGNMAEFTELRRTFREHGVDLISVSESDWLRSFERQLAEVNGTLDEEAAG